MKHIILFEEFNIKKLKKVKKNLGEDQGGTRRIVRLLNDGDVEKVDINKPSLAKASKELKKSIPSLESLMKMLKDRYKKKNLGIDQIKFFDSGTYGMAFVSNDKIIKLTSQENEAEIAKKLLDKKMKGCVNYYDVVYIKTYGIFALLMDKAEKLTDDDISGIDFILDNDLALDCEREFGDCRYDKRTNRYRFTREILQKMKYAEVSRIDVERMIPEVIELKNKLKKSNVPTEDLHWGNIGRLKGKLVHYDIMGTSDENAISKISAVKTRQK